MTGASNIHHLLPDIGYQFTGDGAGSGLVSLKGNAEGSKPVAALSYSFVSGDDSNVVVTIDKNEKDDKRIKIAVDVYYV